MRAVATAVAVIACVLAASGRASSSKKPTTTVRNTALGTAGAAGTLTAQVVQVARGSDRHLSIFPAVPGKRRCSFAEGGTHLTPLVIHGMCSTSIRLRATYGDPSWIVTFTERWRRPECAPDLQVICPHAIARSAWEILEGETVAKPKAIRVLATRFSGATAPQLYK